jgi:ABC transport system ATP-binding/permease protein
MPRLGTTVIKAHNVSFSYGDGREILRKVNLELGPGDRIDIVGPDGAGKSTFVNLLSQHMDPSSGTIKRGPTVVTAYLEQNGGRFDPEKNRPRTRCRATRHTWLTHRRGADEALLVHRRVTAHEGERSLGGERRRLQLLRTLTLRPNVLFLDEPTNDLDLEINRLNENFLRQWPGTLIVVSHDRTFLSRTTDRMLEVHQGGTAADVPGGIDAWVARAVGVVTSPISKEENPGASGTSPGVPLGRQVRDAEKEMARLDRHRNTLNTKILASTDREEQSRLGSELEDVQRQLTAAEE